MFFLLTLITFTITLLTIWHKRTYNYWSIRNVNGPKPYFLLGNIPQLMKVDIRTVDKEFRAKYGKIFGEYFATQPQLVVSDVQLATQILVKDFNIFKQTMKNNSLPDFLQRSIPFGPVHGWKRLRSAMTPPFSSGKLRKSVQHLEKPMKNFVHNLNKLIREGKADTICIAEIVKFYSLDALFEYVFSIQVNSFQQRSDPLVTNMWKLVYISSLPFTLGMMLPKWIAWILTPWIVDRKAAEFYYKMSLNIIQQRQANRQIEYNDFCDFLLKGSNDLTNLEHADHCLIVFFGAVDTVTRALSIILSDLAIRPEMQGKIWAEIQDKLDQDEQLTYDKINEFKYLDAFICESLRLTSLFNRISRYASKDYQLPGTDIILKKDNAVWINVYNIHHDETIYPQPYEFRPERFMGEEKLKIPSCAWLPFSAGSRNCAGFRLAMIEMKYFLIKLIQNYEIELGKDCKLPILYGSGLFLTIPDSLKIKFNPRDNA